MRKLWHYLLANVRFTGFVPFFILSQVESELSHKSEYENKLIVRCNF